MLQVYHNNIYVDTYYINLFFQLRVTINTCSSRKSYKIFQTKTFKGVNDRYKKKSSIGIKNKSKKYNYCHDDIPRTAVLKSNILYGPYKVSSHTYYSIVGTYLYNIIIYISFT